ncbi:MFS general substrate transporter [Mycena metata]|uniref:MFS general substrate transporter n=1 Tax=Mycena metata TaxID=1033252 RepID=A0AAD7NM19_9AGAR|nr:MFS general substrate transporter [Mycena metata]
MTPSTADERIVPKDPTGLNSEERKPPAFPEGGFQAWATVAGAFLVLFCGLGYSYSFGVFQEFYTRDYLSQSSASAISWIGSVNSLLLIAPGLITGRLYDRGYFYHLLYGGSLLLSFSLFMLSFCKPQKFYQIFLAHGLGAGLGTGMAYLPSITVVSHYFQRRRSLAMIIVSSGAAFRSVVHPIMLNNTLRRLGFTNAVRASAGLVSGLLLIACIMMRLRLPPSAIHLPFWKSLRRFSRDKAYVFATMGLTTYIVGYYFPPFYLQLDAIQHGINQTLSFYSVSILALRAFKHIDSPLMPPLLVVLTEDLGELGLRMGVAFTVVGIGGLIGPPIDGALLTDKYIWWRPALFSGIMAFVGVAFFVATLFVVKRRDATKSKVSGKQKSSADGE